MTMATEEYAGPLRSVIDKGQYELPVMVCGDEVLMHVSRVKEERAVNAATANIPILDRDYEKWVHRLARVCTRINGKVFSSPDDALKFFDDMAQPQIEEYVMAYSNMVTEVRDRLAVKVQEIKN